MAGGKSVPKKDVIVQPLAFASMVLHAVSHKHEQVHGLLLGKCENNIITVSDAVPVCHSAPTRPLVEMAIGLVQVQTQDSIVGWYTAPPLLEDTQPGPVALRMAANLETEEIEPTLIVIQNVALTDCLKKEGKAEAVLQALGKDFGHQWLDPLKTSLHNSSSVVGAVKQAIEKGVAVPDLVDHFDGDPSTPWYPNQALIKLL